MGLSNAISGGIILFGITYIMFTFGGFTDKTLSVAEVSADKLELENKLSKTSFTIDSITTAAPSPTVTIDITNTGIEKFWEFEKFDVIITYDSLGTTYTEKLSYSDTCPAISGSWCLVLFSNDVVEPEILNQGESLTIEATVSRVIQLSSTIITVISTQNGVVVIENEVT